MKASLPLRHHLVKTAEAYAAASAEIASLDAPGSALMSFIKAYFDARREIEQRWYLTGTGPSPEYWHKVATKRAQRVARSQKDIVEDAYAHAKERAHEQVRELLARDIEWSPVTTQAGAETATPQLIQKKALELARRCRRYTNPRNAVLETLRMYADRALLDEQNHADVARACDPRWHARKMHRTVRHEIESTWRLAIHRGFLPTAGYDGVAPDTLRASVRRDRADAHWRKTHIAQGYTPRGTLGREMPLGDCDPARAEYAELIAGARGVGTLAEELGLIPKLVTVTAPGKVHLLTTANGKRRPNANWDGSDPGQIATEMQRRLESTRKRLNERGIGWHYVRAIEPQRDGTPHFHIVAWADEAHWPEIERQLTHQFLTTWVPDEPGAQQRRIDVQTVKGGTEGAVAYIARVIAYMCPGAPESARSKPPRKDPATYRAWARVWNARLIQASALFNRSIWRKLRPRDQPDDGSQEWIDAQSAARNGGMAAFLEALYRPSGVHPIRANRCSRKAIMFAGERDQNRYGEPTTRGRDLCSGITGEIVPRLLKWVVCEKEDPTTAPQTPSPRAADSYLKEPRGQSSWALDSAKPP